MNAGKQLVLILIIFFLGMGLGTALTYNAINRNYDKYTASTSQNDFTRSVGSVLENPIPNPRIGVAPWDMPVVFTNYRNHDGRYPIGDITKGTELTEFGRINDGRVLVCFSTNGLAPEPYCANGNAFLVGKEDEKAVFG